MKKILPFLGLLFLTACNKKEDVSVRTGDLDVPLVTGFEYRDDLGNTLMHVGVPNIKNREAGISLYTYPNPSRNKFAVDLSTYFWPTVPEVETHIWVTAARIDGMQPQLNFAGSYTPVIGGQPLIEFKNLPYQSNQIMLDLSAFPAGAYRVYARVGEVLLWDNILLQK
jgi:hypothetical protein